MLFEQGQMDLSASVLHPATVSFLCLAEEAPFFILSGAKGCLNLSCADRAPGA